MNQDSLDKKPPTRQALLEEERKVRFARTLVDLSLAMLRQTNLSVDEALDLVNSTKRRVLALFPDKEDTYNLIYWPRFERLLTEKFGRGEQL